MMSSMMRSETSIRPSSPPSAVPQKQITPRIEKKRPPKSTGVVKVDPSRTSVGSSKPQRPTSAPNRKKAENTQRRPKKSKKASQSPTRSSSSTQQIELLRRNQNQHLLQVLEEEQIAEEQREAMMKQVKDVAERRRLEKIFGVERARASERIMRITEDHETVLKQRMSDMGLMV